MRQGQEADFRAVAKEIRGALKGWPVMLVGTSPSLDETGPGAPKIYRLLEDENLITAAINGALNLFEPDYWIAIDSKVAVGSRHDPPEVPHDRNREYGGIRIFSSATMLGKDLGVEFMPVAFNGAVNGFEKASPGHLSKYGTSDCYLLQLFGGIMGASPIFLVGIDHNPGEHGKTHAADLHKIRARRGRRHNFCPKNFVKRCYDATQAFMAETGAEVYTCTPWKADRSMSAKFFQRVDFMEAFETCRAIIRRKRGLTEAVTVEGRG